MLILGNTCKIHSYICELTRKTYNSFRIYAFFDDGHCQLPCIAAVNEKNECECPHTSLNLTLNESRISMEGRKKLKLMAMGKYAAMIVFGTRKLFINIKRI